jgi:NitT/TauT family transport system ATP-binding protein
MERAVTIALERVSKEFRSRDGAATLAVAEIDLQVADGEFVVIVGPSGCGKTTVLNMIAGLDAPSSGRILVDGRPVTGPGVDRGVMFQDYALFPWRNVEENIAFPLRFGPAGSGFSDAEIRERVAAVVAVVGLRNAERKYPHQLSGGMRQRVALARLLAYEPGILLMDEPLAALDAQTRIILQDELLRIWGQDGPGGARRTVVFITHAIDEAVFLADRVVVMSRHPGRVRDIVSIDLPRPRTDETRTSADFQRHVQAIWSQIKSEAYQAVAA